MAIELTLKLYAEYLVFPNVVPAHHLVDLGAKVVCNIFEDNKIPLVIYFYLYTFLKSVTALCLNSMLSLFFVFAFLIHFFYYYFAHPSRTVIIRKPHVRSLLPTFYGIFFNMLRIWYLDHYEYHCYSKSIQMVLYHIKVEVCASRYTDIAKTKTARRQGQSKR